LFHCSSAQTVEQGSPHKTLFMTPRQDVGNETPSTGSLILP
jgi:hypothetical protein